MPSVEFNRNIAVSPSRMIELLESPSVYPQVFSRITDVTRVTQTETDSGTQTEMDVTLAFRVLSGKVRVVALTNKTSSEVTVKLIKGPFKLAVGKLKLLPSSEGSNMVGACKYDTSMSLFSDLIQKKFDVLLETICTSIEQYEKRQR